MKLAQCYKKSALPTWRVKSKKSTQNVMKSGGTQNNDTDTWKGTFYSHVQLDDILVVRGLFWKLDPSCSMTTNWIA